MRTGPNIRKRVDGRFEARYEKARDASGRIIYGYCYGKTYEEAENKRAALMEKAPAAAQSSPQRTVRRMNLLILGAGSQGLVVKEAAEALGVFHKIAFLDDDLQNRLAIDTCRNYEKYVDLYPIALPSFGNCRLRAQWIERLAAAGFILPTLIHPMATVSPSAVIGEGTFVEMKAIVNTGAHICSGCIISSGAVIDLNAAVEESTHVGSSVIVKKDAVVPAFSVLQSGTVFG